MSYSSGNKFDPGFQQLNELYSWVFDSELPEAHNSDSLQISSFSPGNTSYDSDFEHYYEQFHQNQIPDVDASRGYQNSNISYEEFDPTFEKVNDQFLWDDDSKASEIGQFRGHPISDDFSGDIFDSIFGKLNELFSWVNDCKLFEECGSGGQHTCCNCKNVERNNKKFHDDRESLKKISKPTEPCFGNDDEIRRNKFTMSNEKISKDVDEINAMLRQLTRVPDKPECEEEDLYLRCRRDAIQMMSAATKHLSEAKNARLRGDHTAAKRLSQKAQEERVAAQRLHAEAARKLLGINNKNNGIMKLDLHCLHVPEAIQAVKERLHKIETQMGSKNTDEQALIGKLKRQRLEVITGRGKHSPGTPKLPAAVRSFLNKNDYKYDCSRPGVIMVRPKFCAT